MIIEKYNKRWLLLSALLLIFTVMSAEDKNAVKVYEADGNVVTYELSVRPSVRFSEDELVLKAGDVEVFYPLSPSVRFEFAEISKETTDIQGKLARPTFRITADEMVIHHVSPNSAVSIYDLAGQVIKSEYADSKGHIIMDSHNLPKGTYIIKSEQVTFKIFIK